MSKTKAELQEELEILAATLSAAQAEIEELKSDERKRYNAQRVKAQKQADKLETERQALYAEAKDVYSQALRVARDTYKSYEQEIESNLGMVATQVRSQVMYTLKQVFGDDL